MDGGLGFGPRRRPMKVKEITEEAESFDFNSNISLKHWVGAAETLQREGEIYKEEGNYANAYLLLLRHCNLVLHRFPSHPLAKTPEGRRQLRKLSERLPVVMKELEEIKPYIEAAYEDWERMSAAGQVETQPADSSGYGKYAARDPALSWNRETQAQLLDAGNNQELAIRLAKDDYRRRDAARRSIRQAGISEQEEHARRSGGVWEDWDSGRGGEGGDDLQRRLQDTRRRLDHSDDMSSVRVEDFSRSRRRSSGHRRSSPPPTHRSAPSYSYNYPSINRSSAIQYDPSPIRPRPGSSSSSSYPTRPPKERYPSPDAPEYRTPPPIPQKVDHDDLYDDELTPAPPQVPPKKLPSEESVNKTATVDKAITDLSKRKNITFLPAGYTEGGKALRPIFVPKHLKDVFLSIAEPNTRKGLELCGVICGRPINNALFVGALLIPTQTCTTDTCETEDEYQIYDFCERENMIVIGWIHTHPTQTCFMSSRDLHTHAGYQTISPEAIAIVCAPKYEPSFGVFRLTDPPGLPHILRCPHTNTFHQHELAESELYRSAMHPVSHVYMSEQIEFDVADLRPKQR